MCLWNHSADFSPPPLFHHLNVRRLGMIVMSLENRCLPYITSARGLAGLDGGHIVKVQEWKLTGKVACCAVGLALFAVNSLVLITLFGIINHHHHHHHHHSYNTNNIKYRQYTVVFGEVFPTLRIL